MVPPGLAYVAVSEKAWKVVEACTTPRFYFDWRHLPQEDDRRHGADAVHARP